MGRKSALTEKQWQQIGERLLKGEPGRVLAREYGVSEAAIRKRFGAQTKQIKTVANQLVAAETAFAALPISAQISARSLADELKEISSHLAGAARYGAATAHRLSGLANAQVAKIDDTEPLGAESMESLKGISALTRLANESSAIAMNLLSANKDSIKPEDDAPESITIRIKRASKDGT
ncbi:MAG: helix-turn-helix domain-containing protein [Xanthobacteraceae bacterium]